MNSLKANFEVVAVGNIEMRAMRDSRIDEILDRNRDAIEEIWQKTLIEKGGKLFNGTLPNFVRVNREKDRVEVVGHFIEYKQFLAQHLFAQSLPEVDKPFKLSGDIPGNESNQQQQCVACGSGLLVQKTNFRPN